MASTFIVGTDLNSGRELKDMPLEIVLMICENLDVQDLVRLSKVNRGYQDFVQTQAKSLAGNIARKHTRRLQHNLFRLDFTGMDILTALQTFISVIGPSYNREAHLQQPGHRPTWLFDFAVLHERSNRDSLNPEQHTTRSVSVHHSITEMVEEMFHMQIILEREMPMANRHRRQGAWLRVRQRWYHRWSGFVANWWPAGTWGDEAALERIYSAVADDQLFGPGFSLIQPSTCPRLDPKRHTVGRWTGSEMERCDFVLKLEWGVATKAPGLWSFSLPMLRYSFRNLTKGMRDTVMSTEPFDLKALVIAALFERAELCNPM